MSTLDIQADIDRVKAHLIISDGIRDIKFCENGTTRTGEVIVIYKNGQREALDPRNFRCRFSDCLWYSLTPSQ